MKIRATTVATFLVYALLIVAVIGLFIFQQQRITTDEANYNHLFAQYSKSVRDCARASDCTSTVPSPTVIKGTAGTPGVNGANGANATEDQVTFAVQQYCEFRDDCQGIPGLDGMNGLPGANGTNGVDGTDGTDGTNGTNGTNGQPPVGWTVTTSKGNTQTCVRATPFDASSPQYTCTTTVSTPSPTPTP